MAKTPRPYTRGELEALSEDDLCGVFLWAMLGQVVKPGPGLYTSILKTFKRRGRNKITSQLLRCQVVNYASMAALGGS